MLKRLLLSISSLLCLSTTFAAKIPDNIQIDEYNNDYYLITKSNGELSEVKSKASVTYSALRSPGKAIFFVYYDDFTKIDKAKAKGAKPIYASAKSEGIFFSDSRVCLMRIPIEKINSPVTASMERTFTRPEQSDLVQLFNLYPIKKYLFTLHVPAALKDRFDVVVENQPPKCNVERKMSADGKEYLITVTAYDLPAIDSEDSAPATRYFAPYIRITGIYRSVGELYKAFHSYVAESDPDPEPVARKAAEITAGCNDTKSKIDAVQSWVHDNIRYIAIENGELGHAPEIASRVLANRYGDCKGSASLIVGMLRSLGIDSRLVWIGTDDIPTNWSEWPSFSVGNHMIAAVMPGDGSIMFIDGTTGPAESGYLPTGIQGKEGLIEDGDSYILRRVPTLEASANTDSIVATFELNGMSLNGRMSDYMTGVMKKSVMSILRDSDSKAREKVLIQVAALNRKNVRISEVTLSDKVADGEPICVAADVEIPNVLTVSGDKTYLHLKGIFPDLSARIIETKDRKYPARLSSRNVQVVENTVIIPDNYEIETVPDDVSITNDILEASVVYRRRGNNLEIHLSVTVKELDIPLDRIAGYNDNVRTLMRAISQSIILKQKS